MANVDLVQKRGEFGCTREGQDNGRLKERCRKGTVYQILEGKGKPGEFGPTKGGFGKRKKNVRKMGTCERNRKSCCQVIQRSQKEINTYFKDNFPIPE